MEPDLPRWKTYLNYAFSLAETATHYLPPSWDILGAVGLIMTQIKVSDGYMQKFQDIYESRKKLDTKTATISHHMIKAILETCSKICPSPRRDRLKLYQTFSKRGF